MSKSKHLVFGSIVEFLDDRARSTVRAVWLEAETKRFISFWGAERSIRLAAARSASRKNRRDQLLDSEFSPGVSRNDTSVLVRLSMSRDSHCQTELDCDV